MRIYTDGDTAFYVNNKGANGDNKHRTVALYFENGKLYSAQTLIDTADTWGKPCDVLPEINWE